MADRGVVYPVLLVYIFLEKLQKKSISRILMKAYFCIEQLQRDGNNRKNEKKKLMSHIHTCPKLG